MPIITQKETGARIVLGGCGDLAITSGFVSIGEDMPSCPIIRWQNSAIDGTTGNPITTEEIGNDFTDSVVIALPTLPAFDVLITFLQELREAFVASGNAGAYESEGEDK